ncbi:MAG: AAA family ATPase [Patescibacteria group bacterium]
MRLKNLELSGFKSFAHKTTLEFTHPVVCIVGPNGSGKSNVVEAFRFVLGEQSMKSMRGKMGLDLIFKGSKDLPKSSRALATIYFNNPDKVFKLSDDAGENVNLNYDTVSVSREVFSDGLNKYILNGSEVRLKDINNLLASVNIGSSGHHIISQGEADRILNASPRDLREIIEDALGLKIYQYKIRESERKLERSQENIKEVTMLRRENAPHLNFLKKQVEKFEKTKEMQIELAGLYRAYLKKESVYLERETNNLSAEKNKISSELKNIVSKIDDDKNENKEEKNKKIEELNKIEKKINETRAAKNELERKLGRLEGMLEVKENKVKIAGRCPLCGNEIKEIHPEQIEKRQNEEKELAELQNSRTATLAAVEKIEVAEKEETKLVEILKQEINKEMESLRDKERAKFAFKVRHQELSGALDLLNIKETNLSRGLEALQNEIKEGIALIGEEVLSYRDFKIDGLIDAQTQEEQRRKIERLKIKLEDAGGSGGTEIMKEFEEVSKRDQFLAKEMEDLARSIESLEKIMVDLKEKIDLEFKEGVKKIKKEFQEFFSLMFNGGTGSLSIVVSNKKPRRPYESGSRPQASGKYEELEEEGELEEEFVPEEGVEINVSLPHKKVKELHALSGGERSLTSIALLFAMSQVNPPPFLILDETDAALDEANSRKFGDMVERLSKHSQLIVVTHNRETMSRAGMLYGVTIGADGASKLLSIKFDEAVAIAK